MFIYFITLVAMKRIAEATKYANSEVDANRLIPWVQRLIASTDTSIITDCDYEVHQVYATATDILLNIIGDIVREARGGVDEELF